MKRVDHSTGVAGIDVSKKRLDAAVYGGGDVLQVGNDAAGHIELVAWLQAQGVRRVGLEATGGYERNIRDLLDAEGFEVVLHQPMEVRLFARLRRLKAKNDGLDAALIAAATVHVEAVKAASDPKLRELADRLTAYEQVTDVATMLKTCLEHVALKDVERALRAQIRALQTLKRKFLDQVLAKIAADAELRRRFDLLRSLPGFGQVVAAALVIRMPELGSMKRGQPAALLGVAPYDRDSGDFKGMRFISGGRSRPRRMVYLAAIAAKRRASGFRATAERLLARGKPPKLVNIAVARKLIEAANLVLARGTPWQPIAPA